METIENKEMFLDLKEVMKKTTFSKSTIYSMAKEGTFPKQRRSGKRRVVWDKNEVENWMRSKFA